MKNQAAIVVAVVLAVFATLGMWAYLKKMKQEKATGTVQMKVMRASKDIAEGERLTPDNVEPASVRAQDVRGMDAITWTEKEFYLNMYDLQQKVGKGTYITQQMLLRRGRRSMATELSPGERAITIGVDQITGVAGYVRPGDRVDIYAAFTVPDPTQVGKRSAATRTYLLLSNVRILRTGVESTMSRRRGFASKAAAYTSVTLRVREDNAHILAFSQDQGKLTLVLRPPGDAGEPSRSRIDLRELLQLLEARQAAPKPTGG